MMVDVLADKNSEKTCYAPDNQVNEKPVALVASVTTFTVCEQCTTEVRTPL